MCPAALAALCLCGGALAFPGGPDAPPSSPPLGFSLAPLLPQPEDPFRAADLQSLLSPPPGSPAGPYGKAGSQWLHFGLAAAHNFDGATDFNIHGGWSKFLVEDVEFSLELALWTILQREDDALGINPSMGFRWHFVNTGTWTFFADLGIGVIGTTSNVPPGGTGFNFTPRAGVGLTRRLDTAGTRLEAGFRWHHISNGRIFGFDKNSSRDSPLIHVGIVIPF